MYICIFYCRGRTAVSDDPLYRGRWGQVGPVNGREHVGTVVDPDGSCRFLVDSWHFCLQLLRCVWHFWYQK